MAYGSGFRSDSDNVCNSCGDIVSFGVVYAGTVYCRHCFKCLCCSGRELKTIMYDREFENELDAIRWIMKADINELCNMFEYCYYTPIY